METTVTALAAHARESVFLELEQAVRTAGALVAHVGHYFSTAGRTA